MTVKTINPIMILNFCLSGKELNKFLDSIHAELEILLQKFKRFLKGSVRIFFIWLMLNLGFCFRFFKIILAIVNNTFG